MKKEDRNPTLTMWNALWKLEIILNWIKWRKMKKNLIVECLLFKETEKILWKINKNI